MKAKFGDVLRWTGNGSLQIFIVENPATHRWSGCWTGIELPFMDRKALRMSDSLVDLDTRDGASGEYHWERVDE